MYQMSEILEKSPKVTPVDFFVGEITNTIFMSKKSKKCHI